MQHVSSCQYARGYGCVPGRLCMCAGVGMRACVLRRASVMGERNSRARTAPSSQQCLGHSDYRYVFRVRIAGPADAGSSCCVVSLQWPSIATRYV
eukprot:14338770-Alexandrium_andersonii.AAC.1